MSDLAARVQNAANHLRLLQFDLSDADSDSRREELAGYLRKTLDDIHPEEHDEFLNELRGRFPAWTIDVDEPKAPTRPADRPEMSDWRFVLETLVKLSRAMPAEDRQELAAKLESAGLTSKPSASWKPQTESEFKAKLGLDAARPVRPDRALKMLLILANFARDLESYMWRFWEDYQNGYETSRVKRPRESIDELLGYLVSEPDSTSKDMEENLDKLRQLAGGFTIALRYVGTGVWGRYRKEIHPGTVEERIPSGWSLNKCEKWWAHYRTVAWQKERIESEVRKNVVANVDGVHG